MIRIQIKDEEISFSLTNTRHLSFLFCFFLRCTHKQQQSEPHRRRSLDWAHGQPQCYLQCLSPVQRWKHQYLRFGPLAGNHLHQHQDGLWRHTLYLQSTYRAQRWERHQWSDGHYRQCRRLLGYVSVYLPWDAVSVCAHHYEPRRQRQLYTGESNAGLQGLAWGDLYRWGNKLVSRYHAKIHNHFVLSGSKIEDGLVLYSCAHWNPSILQRWFSVACYGQVRAAGQPLRFPRNILFFPPNYGSTFFLVLFFAHIAHQFALIFWSLLQQKTSIEIYEEYKFTNSKRKRKKKWKALIYIFFKRWWYQIHNDKKLPPCR